MAEIGCTDVGQDKYHDKPWILYTMVENWRRKEKLA